MDNLDNWLPVDTYTSIRVSKYKEKISLQHGKRGENDTYPSWVCPQRWVNSEKRILEKNGAPVFVPLALPLGTDKEKALKILENLVNQVRAL